MGRRKGALSVEDAMNQSEVRAWFRGSSGSEREYALLAAINQKDAARVDSAHQIEEVAGLAEKALEYAVGSVCSLTELLQPFPAEVPAGAP
jgi:hypothetical protein